MVAVLFVARGAVADTLTAWSAHGLLGAAALADPGDVAAAGSASYAAELAVAELTPVRPGRHTRLGPWLASQPDLDVLRVVWVRGCAEDAAGMEPLASGVRSLLPDGADPQFFDVQVPRDREDRTEPQPAARWYRFRVIPEDRPGPGAADSGYVQVREAQAAHVAAVLAGVLGGATHARHVRLEAANQHTRLVHAFSRVVHCGPASRRSVEEYVRVALPRLAAHDVTSAFQEADDAPALVTSAVDWLGTIEDGVLGLGPGRTDEVGPNPRLGPWRTLRLVLSSFRRTTVALVPGRGETLREKAVAALAERWATPDIGIHLDLGLLSKEPGVRSEAEPEVARVARVERALVQAGGSSGTLPSGATWNAVRMMATSLVDGGAAPSGWNRPTAHQLPLTLPAELVDPVRVSPVDGAVVLDEHVTAPSAPGAPRLARELGAISPVVLRAALTSAASRQLGEPAPLEVPARGQVSRFARGFVDEANDEVSTVRSALSRQLLDAAAAVRMDDGAPAAGQEAPAAAEAGSAGGSPHGPRPVPSVPPATSFIDRLSARIAADLLTARLRARVLGTAALERRAVDDAAVPRALRSVRWAVVVGLLLLVLCGVVWWGFRDQVEAWLEQVMAGVTLASLLMGVVGLVLATVLERFLAVYRAQHKRYEQLRRRAEVGDLLAKQAIEAYGDAARLDNVQRIWSLWRVALTSLFDAEPARGPSDNEGGLRTPSALRVAVPVLHELETRDVLDRSVARPGWRSAALGRVLAAHTEDGRPMTIEAIESDLGHRLGHLDRLTHPQQLPRLVAAAWEEAIDQATDEVRRSLARLDRNVEPALDEGPTSTVREFLDEVAEDHHYAPERWFVENGWVAEDVRAARVDALRGSALGGAGDVTLNEAVIQVACRLDTQAYVPGSAGTEMST